jgi:excisionase family DNA binding protein
MESQKLYTIEDVCISLSIGRTKLYELIGGGELKTIKLGKSRRITSESLSNYINSKQAEQLKY